MELQPLLSFRESHGSHSRNKGLCPFQIELFQFTREGNSGLIPSHHFVVGLQGLLKFLWINFSPLERPSFQRFVEAIRKTIIL